MAVGMWRGVNNVARKIKKRYRGVDNVTREVKKRWRSVDNVARLTFKSNEFTFEWEDNNDGLASFTTLGTNSRFFIQSGTTSSTAALRIYGDFSGKSISFHGVRDTDGSGGAYLYSSNGNILGGTGFTDDSTSSSGRYSGGAFDDCAYLRLTVGGGTSSKSRYCELLALTVDGVNMMPELLKEAIEFFGL